jgi:hypothetical protein
MTRTIGATTTMTKTAGRKKKVNMNNLERESI